jgi:hypothetical protein
MGGLSPETFDIQETGTQDDAHVRRSLLLILVVGLIAGWLAGQVVQGTDSFGGANKGGRSMMREAIAVSLILIPAPALAEWKVEQQGTKVMSHRNDPVGTIARLAAEAPSRDITAYLQVECFKHPPLSGKHFGVVLSKATTPGPITYEYEFDDAAPVLRGPYSRRRLTVVSLGDAESEEFKGLSKAKRLQLTLLPRPGPELTFDFDLSGGASAIDAIPCKEKSP